MLLYINEAPFKERATRGSRRSGSRLREQCGTRGTLRRENSSSWSNAEMALELSVRPSVRAAPAYF